MGGVVGSVVGFWSASSIYSHLLLSEPHSDAVLETSDVVLVSYWPDGVHRLY